MTAAIRALLLLMQLGQFNDFWELRDYVGLDFRAAMQKLDAKNQALIRNTARLAPAQAGELRLRLKTPEKLPQGETLIALTDRNFGLGLVSDLFESDFIIERVNLIFCGGRVMAIQVLLDASRAFGQADALLQTVYKLPTPAAFERHKPAFEYPLIGVTYDETGNWQRAPSALHVTVWDLKTAEAVFQPIVGQRLVTGQLWIADKDLAKQCSLPKM